MPAHIYIRVGRYHDATLTNFAASTADKDFLAVCRGSNGIYPLGYVPAQLALRRDDRGAARLAHAGAGGRTPDRATRRHGEARRDELHAAVRRRAAVRADRFGEWDAILAQQRTTGPAALSHRRSGISPGAWRYARTGKVQAAQTELQALRRIAADPSLEKVALWDINHADRVLDVAEPMLRGEIALAARPAPGGHRLAAQGGGRRGPAQLQRTAGLAVAGAPVPGCGAARCRPCRRKRWRSTTKTLPSIPTTAGRCTGRRKAQRALKQADAASESERRQAAAWQWADVKLTASRF